MVAFFHLSVDPSAACSHCGTENGAWMWMKTTSEEMPVSTIYMLLSLNKGNVYAATAFLHIDFLNRQTSVLLYIFFVVIYYTH